MRPRKPQREPPASTSRATPCLPLPPLAAGYFDTGLELEVEEAGAGVAKKQLVGLIQELLREKMLSSELLKTRLDAEMLQARPCASRYEPAVRPRNSCAAVSFRPHA